MKMETKITFKAREPKVKMAPRNRFKATIGPKVIASDRTKDGLKVKVQEWLSRNGTKVTEAGYTHILIYERNDVWRIEKK
jgi:hypothetical protein